MAQGVKDSTIARRLGISIVTVRRRAYRFRKRVGAETRTQAVAIAMRDGILPAPKGQNGQSEHDSRSSEEQ